ncbi:MAG: right-handed parallel beta-helix repeat-containing protein, partial [Deltaproteobacteria bacterium]|nr:right-handed parallel beta-helix repeat-containing protein [Deltaproteobacteria bacterium]
MTGDVTVQGTANPVLTIEPGVTVKFSPYQGLNVGWDSPGGLQAVGTVGNPITFTSSAASPTRGSWRHIYFSNKALPTSRLAFATVSWAGYANPTTCIYVVSSSPTIDHVTVSQSSGTAIEVTGAGASPTISNTTLANNAGTGLYLKSGATAMLSGLTATDNGGYVLAQEPGITIASASGLVATGNAINGIAVWGG